MPRLSPPFCRMKSYGQHLIFLELLVSCHPKQRRALLRTISDSQVNFLSLVLHNILQGKLILDHSHKQRLQRHASLIRRIARKSTVVSVKQDLFLKHNRLVRIIFAPLLQDLKDILLEHGNRIRFSSKRKVGKEPQADGK